MTRFGLAAIMLLGVALPLQGQQALDTIQIRPVKLTDELYVLVGAGGNIGLSIGDDGPFIVDDQFAPLTAKIQAAIAALSPKPVRWVLNSHWHGDHTGGNENFGTAGALIVAHDNVRRRMNPAEFKELIGRSQQAPEVALPVVTFNDEVTFHWNGETIHVFHVPNSHTDGDAIIHFVGANVIHMGDTFFNGRYPFIDTQSGGSVQGMIASSDQILAMSTATTRLIPGHGEVASPAELRAYRDMLVSARDAIAPLVARGMTEDGVVAAKPTATLDATWGQSSERFVRSVYQSLTARR
ncbi:MAG: MBL fold metallo-hydrolase [Gemmatimonadales bacterium]